MVERRLKLLPRLLLTTFPMLMAMTACQVQDSDLPKRPDDPWVMRSVLDQQIRMVTLAMNEQHYVAYNTENCGLYKVWKGGVHWNGAAFNNVKTVQPESWGISYWQRTNARPWKIELDGQQAVLKPLFKGYRIKDARITFQYQFILPSGDTINIHEQPELTNQGEKGVSFSRRFQTRGIPKNVKIWNDNHLLPFNAEKLFIEAFDPLPAIDPTQYAGEISGWGSQYWLDRSGCNTCHEMDQQTIGPSYHQIASRYEDDDLTIDLLVNKVIAGGSGVWGEVPMNPHPQIPEDDVYGMVEYILSLKPREVEEFEEEDEEEGEAQLASPGIPGFGLSLAGLHPALEAQIIYPALLKPRVGGMDFLSDGTLLISTWDSLGAVYALKGVETGDTSQIEVKRIAAGLAEPLGLKVVEDEIFVLQKQELTQLIDHDNDEIIDEYRSICNTWGATTDFHEFSYGLEYKDGFFYATLGLAMRLMSHELQDPDRGTAIKISRDGSYEVVMDGLRQANGIGFGPEGALFVTENQGQWVPACKVIHIQEGQFHGCQYGMGSRHKGKSLTPPAVWLPQDEIGNSPGQPALMDSGPYQGQMVHGEITHGGLKRVFLEKIDGQYQGAVFRFTQGLEAGINRVVWGPDDALYVGGVGMNGNWGWKDKQYGLQRLHFVDNIPFEILQVEATPNGFRLTFTEALGEGQGEKPSDFTVQQWWYETTPDYGGPKMDLKPLDITNITISVDRKSVILDIAGLKEQHVIYFLLNDALKSKSGKSLWSGEAWYTLNRKPALTSL